MLQISLLLTMSMSQANRLPFIYDRRRWVSLHNDCGNFYFLNKEGKICKVPPEGWWY